MDCPRLETRRLVLRALTRDDRYGVFANFADPDVAKWFFDRPCTQIEEADRIIDRFIQNGEQGNGLCWAILLKADGKFVGTCSYEHIDEDLCAEVGFDLAKEHGRQGYMTEALGAVITFGFTALGLARIRADTYSSNAGARRVLEKVGFGVHSVEDDSHCYELLRTDWTRSHG